MPFSFLESQLAYYRSIRDESLGGERREHPFAWAYRKFYDAPDGIEFLDEEDSYVIAGVEHAMHGHRGTNGVRGSRANLSQIGDKLNIGHSHSAGITDGTYQAGVTGKLDMGYNRGAP